MLITKYPDFSYKKTLLQIYENKKPFKKLQEVEIDFESQGTIVSLDRRSTIEQDSNRFIVLALTKPELMNR